MMKTIIYSVNKRKELPATPGVYRFIDEDGQVLYIGKSVNLKSRVNSYFQTRVEGDRPDKLLRMRRFIAVIEVTATLTELEAEWLEQALIEKYRPQYNQQMKSNRRHGYLVLEPRKNSWQWKTVPLEELRQLQITENRELLIGPFRNPRNIKERLDILFNFHWLGDWSYSPLPLSYKDKELAAMISWLRKVFQSFDHFHRWIREVEKKRDFEAERLAFEQAARYQEVIGSVSPVGAALSRRAFFEGETQPFVIEKQGTHRYGYRLSKGQLIRRTWQMDQLPEADGINYLRNEPSGEDPKWTIRNLDQEMILYRAFQKKENRILGCFL